MELSRARRSCCIYSHAIVQRSLSSFPINPENPFSPCVCHRLPLENLFRVTLCIRSSRPTLKSMLTARKGHSIPIFDGSCDVVWILETELGAGQQLYVTGDLPVLGGWQPKKAIKMLSEDARMWKTEVKTPSGMNFKYNYFVVDESRASCDISWRPGPEFSLSVPLNDGEYRRILVRDSWMKRDLEKCLPHMWGSWIDEMHLVEPSILSCSSALTDRNEIVDNLELEEPGKRQSNLSDHLLLSDEGVRYEVADSVLCDRDQPVEEPWLPTFYIISENKQVTEVAGEHDCVKDSVVSFNYDNQDSLSKDITVPVKESSKISEVASPSTIILINSSKCTMQRIAVLEDGELVELLLEPVKSDTLCDSIYLGVFRELAPGMKAAFVDIGRSKPTLMQIEHHIKPFLMNPEKIRKGEADYYLLKNFNEFQSGVQVTDELDKWPTIMSNGHDDHGDYDDLKFLSEQTNGSVLDYEEADGNCQHIVNNREDPKENLVHTSKWKNVPKGSLIIVQVAKEELGKKGPVLTPYPRLTSRFWFLLTRMKDAKVSKKISGKERKRLKDIAQSLQPPGFGLVVRTAAAGHSKEELENDLKRLLMTWKIIYERASSEALAADEGVVPVMLHKAMVQTLSVVRDYFSEKVEKVVVDTRRTYDEVTNYLQDIAPDLCARVELYDKRNPLFSEYKIEEEFNNILNKRVPLDNGGSLVIEQTEALVSIDVNGGPRMLGQGISQEKAVLDVNLAAAKKIARELRLRDIGGIIVVDFIDMKLEEDKRSVYQEMKRAVERYSRTSSQVKFSELSKCGLMIINRKRVRPSVTFMISEVCTCCHGTGRVEALKTTLSKIEQQICRQLASMDQEADPENPKTWPKFQLTVEQHMFQYLTSESENRTSLAILSSSLNVWLILKEDRGFARGSFKLKPFNDDSESDDKSTNPQRRASLVTLKKARKRKGRGKPNIYSNGV